MLPFKLYEKIIVKLFDQITSLIKYNFFVDFKFEMGVNSKKFLYFAKTFVVKRFYY